MICALRMSVLVRRALGNYNQNMIIVTIILINEFASAGSNLVENVTYINITFYVIHLLKLA